MRFYASFRSSEIDSIIAKAVNDQLMGVTIQQNTHNIKMFKI